MKSRKVIVVTVRNGTPRVWGSEGISSANCNVGNRWRLIRPSPRLACEKDIYPSGKVLGGAAEPSGRCGKENRLRSVRTCNVYTVVPWYHSVYPMYPTVWYYFTRGEQCYGDLSPATVKRSWVFT